MDVPSNHPHQLPCSSSQLPDCLSWRSTLAQLSGDVSQTSGRQLSPQPVPANIRTIKFLQHSGCL